MTSAGSRSHSKDGGKSGTAALEDEICRLESYPGELEDIDSDASEVLYDGDIYPSEFFSREHPGVEA